MSPWWWIPIGLAAWFLAAVTLALVTGPVLAGTSRRLGQDSSDEGTGQP